MSAMRLIAFLLYVLLGILHEQNGVVLAAAGLDQKGSSPSILRRVAPSHAVEEENIHQVRFLTEKHEDEDRISFNIMDGLAQKFQSVKGIFDSAKVKQAKLLLADYKKHNEREAFYEMLRKMKATPEDLRKALQLGRKFRLKKLHKLDDAALQKRLASTSVNNQENVRVLQKFQDYLGGQKPWTKSSAVHPLPVR